jgi:hypothetical protein
VCEKIFDKLREDGLEFLEGGSFCHLDLRFWESVVQKLYLIKDVVCEAGEVCAKRGEAPTLKR